MRRQRRPHHLDGDGEFEAANASYQMMHHNANGTSIDGFELDGLSMNKKPHRFENTIEAKVEDGDTLQALALRFHCTVADIKRLNKIDKDNEIHARKVVKIPVTVHSVLLGTLPIVHKSGNSSPKSPSSNGEDSNANLRNPLEDARIALGEKLMVASVNAFGEGGATSIPSPRSLTGESVVKGK